MRSSAKMCVIIGLSMVLTAHYWSCRQVSVNPSSCSIPRPPPLLTMFTTFKDNPRYPHHQFVHRLVIPNWASFMPLVKPVLFTENLNSELGELARNSSWDVLPVTRVNPSGTPYLKDMFKTVFEKYNSTFYGFANGDLFFSDGLTATLHDTKSILEQLQNNVMLVGLRTNVVNTAVNATGVFSRGNLQSLAQKKGKLYTAWAEEYFFFTRNHSLNWSSLADVVIGRAAYDNYLLGIANRQRVNTIDATRTLLSVHMSKSHLEETARKNVDRDFNYKAIGDFDYREGLIMATKYVTHFDFRNRIVIFRRQ